ncbi:tripartite tricarboxylate transporter TctB family protein [Ferdinandcohnia sp. Marseille-Q9671]
MRNEKIIGSILFLIIAGLFFVLSLDFPSVGHPADVGPGFMPKMYSGILTLLSIILLIQGIREIRNKKTETQTIYENFGLVVGIMALSVIYIFLIPYLGFYLVSAIFIILFLLLSRVKKIITIILVSVGTNLFVFLFFEKMLLVPVPVGSLFL